MVTKLKVIDNTRSPLHYISGMKNFRNGTEYEFKPGVNIIVGENGCGKTTLMNLLKLYLMVGYNECERGNFNSNVHSLTGRPFDGVDVYADYDKNTFRLSHAGERERQQSVETFKDFGTMWRQHTSSTGESVIVAMDRMFSTMFAEDANIKFDYGQFRDLCPEYYGYVMSHKLSDCPDEWTVLMDEPDRNLSLSRIKDIKGILSFHKEKTQVIAVVHNPLLIVTLSKSPDVNFIEMTEGYVKQVITTVNELIGN